MNTIEQLSYFVIGKYEGFVAQYLVDRIMAYFGYPQAHEDNAERAVRAGLDLITAVAKLGRGLCQLAGAQLHDGSAPAR